MHWSNHIRPKWSSMLPVCSMYNVILIWTLSAHLLLLFPLELFLHTKHRMIFLPRLSFLQHWSCSHSHPMRDHLFGISFGDWGFVPTTPNVCTRRWSPFPNGPIYTGTPSSLFQEGPPFPHLSCVCVRFLPYPRYHLPSQACRTFCYVGIV